MIKRNYSGVDVLFHIKDEEMNASNLVYILKFPNGEYYVGQTVSKYGLSNRVRQHCEESLNPSKKSNTYKCNVIRKHKKIDVFILHKCENIEDIDFYEIFYINILKRKLVNLESGGNKNKIISDETKEKIKNTNNSADRKIHGKLEVYNLDGSLFKIFDNTSDAATFFKSNSTYMYRACVEKFNYKGQYQFKWEKSDKIIKNLTKAKNENNKLRWDKLSVTINGEKVYYNKLYKYDKNGYLLNEISIYDLSTKEINGIRSSLKHNTFYKGEYWSLIKSNKIDVPKERYEKVSEKKSKRVLQLDDSLKIIKKWKSITEASKGNNISIHSIISVCKHERRHAANYVWCYEKEYENFKETWGLPRHRFRKDTKKGRKELGLE